MTPVPATQTSPHTCFARHITRRRFLALSGAAAATGGLGFYAGEFERHDVDVVERTIRLTGLPGSFAGFRIVQLSDIHLEEFTEASYLEKVVRRINTLRPDLVALTGDFVSNGPLPRHLSIGWGYHCAEILSQLTCSQRYAVLGNHDVMVDWAAITNALVTHHIPVLSNSYVPLERKGERIWFSGLAEAIFLRPNLVLALPQHRDPAREPVIMLAHEPDYADRVTGHQISLVLSGHTHGGQIRIPYLYRSFLPELGRKYVEGLFHLAGGMQLYVNRGIGTVGVPFRFRCRPEITVLTLQPSDASRAVEELPNHPPLSQE